MIIAPYFYTTKHEPFRCGSSAIAAERWGYLQKLDQDDHKEENLSHEQRWHWNIREFDEYIAAAEGRCYQETPEQYVCHMETQAELMAVLSFCTEVQRRRFLLYALDGLSFEQIAHLDGCLKAAVQDSVEAARKKVQNFFKRLPYETPFSG